MQLLRISVIKIMEVSRNPQSRSPPPLDEKPTGFVVGLAICSLLSWPWFCHSDSSWLDGELIFREGYSTQA